MSLLSKDLDQQLKAIEDRIGKLYLSEKEIFNAQEAAEYLGISMKQLYKLTGSRKIAFSKPGGKLMFIMKSDLDSYAMSKRFASRRELETEAIDGLTKKGGQR